MSKELALKLAGLGWRVFPCWETKKPMTRNGFNDATTDPVTIRYWFAPEYPYYGRLVGVACEPSGLFCVDVDNRDAWQEFTAGRPLPAGPTQRTPRGGRHYLYKLPSGLNIPNTAGWLYQGVDLRSKGYFCTGEGYTWTTPPETTLPEAPGWLLEAIHEKQNPQPPSGGKMLPIGNNTQDTGNQVDYLRRYYQRKGVIGARANSCFNLACQLRDLGISEGEAIGLCREYAKNCPQPAGQPFTEREAEKITQAAYKRDPRVPWHKYIAAKMGAA